MNNNIYKLIEPRRFEAQTEKITDIKDDEVMVKPKYMAICAADQRYYTDKRNAEQLKKRLPMALIHECWGEVVLDNENEFNKGDKVLLIPNIRFEKNQNIAENYLI